VAPPTNLSSALKPPTPRNARFVRSRNASILQNDAALTNGIKGCRPFTLSPSESEDRRCSRSDNDLRTRSANILDVLPAAFTGQFDGFMRRSIIAF